jgi:hypothetical protein
MVQFSGLQLLGIAKNSSLTPPFPSTSPLSGCLECETKISTKQARLPTAIDGSRIQPPKIQVQEQETDKSILCVAGNQELCTLPCSTPGMIVS